MFKRDQLFIGGQWVTPSSGQTITVYDSATEESVGVVPEPTTAEIDRAIAEARHAFDEGPWPRMMPTERAAYLIRIAEALDERTEELARTQTQEVGCPYLFCLYGHARAGAGWFRYYAEMADSELWTQTRSRPDDLPTSTLVREPVGVVAAIAPWNAPHYLCCSKLAPALLAGCTVVLKPAAEAALDGYLLADAVHAAGLPKGVVSILPGGRDAGDHLIRSTQIDKVSFTGSTAVGRHIAAVAGQNLVRVSLELGGKSAAIIADDAEPDKVLPTLVFGSTVNNGQACAALTRILVPQPRLSEWTDAIGAAFDAIEVGDPFDEKVTVGPLVSKRQQDRVLGYLSLARKEGGRFVAGGGTPPEVTRGWYIAPTVIAGLTNHARVSREEIFGPVVVVLPHQGDEDAVRIANDSEYGLYSAVYSSDEERARSIAAGVRAGGCVINGVFLDNATPFGGYKASGIGREGGPEGLCEYTEIKSITVLPQG